MDLFNAIELIPKRFYWMSTSKPPINTGNIHYFSIDKTLIYQPFANDFGPLSASCLARYVKIVESKLIDPTLTSSKVVHYCNTIPTLKSNSAVLAIIYTIMALSPVPLKKATMPELAPLIENILGLFGNVQLMPFRDASGSPPTYSLSVGSVVRGMIRAITLGYYDPKSFSVREYDFYEKVENGDMTWIIPKRIIAFAGPEDPVFNAQNGHPLCEHFSLPPGAYVPYFQKHNVRTVIRLNSHRYRRESFESRGIKVFDLIFPDGSCPTSDVSNAFATEIDGSEQDDYAVAVHCKAGLGRTGTLIAMVLMTRGFTAPEAIGYLRVMRPGSVVGWQQNFLLEKELLCRRHELAVPRRLLASSTASLQANRQTKKDEYIHQVKFMRKTSASGSSKQLTDHGESCVTNQQGRSRPVSQSQPQTKGIFTSPRHRFNGPTINSSMGSYKSIGNIPRSPMKESKMKEPRLFEHKRENDIVGMGIGPSPNVERVQMHQQMGIYRISEGTVGESRIYKPPYVSNASKSVGPIQLVGAASHSNSNSNPVHVSSSAISPTGRSSPFIMSATATVPSTTTLTAVCGGKRCVTTSSAKQPQHPYIRLPNLHPATPESNNISPQPRKNASGRFVERLAAPPVLTPVAGTTKLF